MDTKLTTIRYLSEYDNVIHVTFNVGAERLTSLSELEKEIHDYLKSESPKFIFDLVNIQLPPTKFIALMIEATNQTRRLNGDVKFVNISNFSKNNFVTFSAMNYLSIHNSAEEALYEFDPDLASQIKLNDTKPVKPVPEKKPEPKNVIQENAVVTNSPIDTRNMTEEKIKVESKIDSLYQICDFVTDRAQRAGFPLKEIGKIKVTVYEACLNVIEHAYFSNPEHWIEVIVNYDQQKYIITIHDWGENFEFTPAKDYNVEKAVKDRKTGGFGLHIIQRSVDEIYYESDKELGNKLILVKYLASVNNL
jgi:serine/threonine-protein kinase RsbW